MAGKVVSYVLRGDVTQFTASMRAAGASASKLGNDLTAADKGAVKTRAAMSTLGDTALKAGLVVGAGAALAVKAAIDWESAWTGVTKTVNGSASQMEALESGLRGLATTLPATHEEIAGIAEAAGQLGVAQGDILGFTRTMVDLSETTNLTADEAATSIAQFMNVMQTAPEDVDNLGSALVALGNDGASTERDIIMMAQNIAGAGAIVGASEADILALSNALASVGIDAEAGGSAVSKILIDMSTAVATNSKALGTWAQTAGMTTAEFSKSFKDSPVEAFDAFTQGLGRINSEGGDVFSLLQNLGQSDIRVTRALLGMANSGDLLSSSLATGSAEWERNTALANEAGKRYDTAAAKSQIAWNGIKDSAIDAGQAMLPVVANVAEAVSAVADAFGSLPGPVKSTMGVIVAFGGVALVGAGLLAKLTASIAANRLAMASLGTTAPRTATAIGALTKGFLVLTAAATASSALEKWDKADTAGVNEFTRALLDAADGSDKLLNNLTTAKSSGPLGWNRNSVDGLKDAFEQAADAKGKMDLSFGHDSGWERSTRYVEQLDAALTSMVQSGSADEASKAFQHLGEVTNMSDSELMKLLPQYKEGIQGVANAADKAGTKVDKFGVSLDEISPEAKAAQEAMDAMKQSTLDSAMAFFDFGANLDTAKVSLGDYIKDLEDTAKAQADWAENVITATAKGLNPEFIKGLEEQGPAGAKRLAELADASESEIARINAAFGDLGGTGQQLADVLAEVPPEVLTEFSTIGGPGAVDMATTLARKYNLTPDQVETIMKALDFASKDIREVKQRLANLERIKTLPTIGVRDEATGKLQQIQQYINGMHGKIVKIKVEGGTPGGQTVGSAGGGAIPRAEGGPVVGPGTATSDSIPASGPGGYKYALSNGEHILTASDVNAMGGQAQVYAMRAALHSQQRSFARGGQVATAPSSIDINSAGLAALIAKSVGKAFYGTTFQILPDGSVRAKEMGA